MKTDKTVNISKEELKLKKSLAKDDLNLKKSFANLLRKKAANLSDKELEDCLQEIIKSADLYLNNFAFYSNLGKPSQAREELSNLNSSINSLSNQIRLLDSTSLVHLVDHGFKVNATQSTLKHLHEIVANAKSAANSKPDKAANHALTYLVGKIHFLLGKMLSIHRKKSSKKLVNDIFPLVAKVRFNRFKARQGVKAVRLDAESQRGIIPDDIGRQYNKALKLKLFSLNNME